MRFRILRIFTRARASWSKWSDKNVLTFGFFLLLSASFWFFLTVHEEYEDEFIVSLQLTDVPPQTLITTDLPQTATVVLKDRGSELLKYRYSNSFSSVAIDFQNYTSTDGHVVVPTSDITKLISRKLQSTTRIVSFKSDRLEYFYNEGAVSQRMPITLRSNVKPAPNYGISSLTFTPDSVTVYAPAEVLDTLGAIYTEPFNQYNVHESVEQTLSIAHVRGAKIEPSEVKVSLTVDQLTEKQLEVPIQALNFPASKILRTFPAKVRVIFRVSLANYRHITADDFIVALNYEDLLRETGGSVTVTPRSVPEGADKVRIEPSVVEFLIEDAAPLH